MKAAGTVGLEEDSLVCTTVLEQVWVQINSMFLVKCIFSTKPAVLSDCRRNQTLYYTVIRHQPVILLSNTIIIYGESKVLN